MQAKFIDLLSLIYLSITRRGQWPSGETLIWVTTGERSQAGRGFESLRGDGEKPTPTSLTALKAPGTIDGYPAPGIGADVCSLVN